METKTITININAEVLAKLRKLAEHEKKSKGFLGRTISEAAAKYVQEKEQEEIKKKLIARMEKGYDMGKILIKHRDELYDRR